MRPRISVALATYNGSNYLKQQLESLADQIYLPYELVVCDDNSTDDTLDIVAEFAERSPFPVVIHRNDSNIGPIANFFQALSFCKGDWLSFCDQDDIWLHHKLFNVANTIRKRPRAVCILQYALLVDSNLIPYSSDSQFPRLDLLGTKLPNSLPLFFEWHGFLTTFNKSILSYLNNHKLPLNIHPSYGRQSHDQWVSFISRITGNVEILPGISAYYRRHTSTVTGSYIAKRPHRSSFDEKRKVLRRLALCSSSCRRYCLHYSFKAPHTEHQVRFLQAARHYDSYGKISSLKYRLLRSSCAFCSARLLLILFFNEIVSICKTYPSASFSSHKYTVLLFSRLLNINLYTL
jgi:glycosyltransferase involved in cell wall biosynthesis